MNDERKKQAERITRSRERIARERLLLSWSALEFAEAEKEYLIYRFGLENQEEHSLQETAKHFSISEEKAHVNERIMLERLLGPGYNRQPCPRRKLRDFL